MYNSSNPSFGDGLVRPCQGQKDLEPQAITQVGVFVYMDA